MGHTQAVPCEGESRLPTAEQGLAGPGRADAWCRVRRHGCELVVFNGEADVNQKMDVERTCALCVWRRKEERGMRVPNVEERSR